MGAHIPALLWTLLGEQTSARRKHITDAQQLFARSRVPAGIHTQANNPRPWTIWHLCFLQRPAPSLPALLSDCGRFWAHLQDLRSQLWPPAGAHVSAKQDTSASFWVKSFSVTSSTEHYRAGMKDLNTGVSYAQTRPVLSGDKGARGPHSCGSGPGLLWLRAARCLPLPSLTVQRKRLRSHLGRFRGESTFDA